MAMCKRTAIHRKKISAPANYLISKELLNGKVLDFGCGHGDLRFANSKFIELWEWDKFNQPLVIKNGKELNNSALPINYFDNIYCGYVLNVLPKKERNKVLNRLKSLLSNNGTIFISVRRDISKAGNSTQYWVELPATHIKITNSFCIYTLTK